MKELFKEDQQTITHVLVSPGPEITLSELFLKKQQST